MPNYKPYVFRAQGATELTVASGGVIAVEDGGVINLESGGALRMGGTAVATSSGGWIQPGAFTLSSQFNFPVQTASSGLVALRTYGISYIYSSGTGTGPAGYTLAAATAAGQYKGIIAGNDCTSTAPAVVTLTGTLLNGLTTITFSTGKTNEQYVHLIAQNTTNWVVISKSTNAAFA